MVAAAVFSVAVGVAVCFVAALVVCIAAIVLVTALVLAFAFVLALLVAVFVVAAVVIAGPIVLFGLATAFLASTVLASALRPPRVRPVDAAQAPEDVPVVERGEASHHGAVAAAGTAPSLRPSLDALELEGASEVTLQRV